MGRLRIWVPAIVWAAVIWLFSTHLFDSHATSRFLIPLLEWLLPDAPAETLRAIHFGIRKMAHFGEYFVLGVLVFRAVRGEGRGWQLRWALGTLAIVAGYASVDELHQSFVPTRGAMFTDVLLDSAGGVAALGVLGSRARKQRQLDLPPDGAT